MDVVTSSFDNDHLVSALSEAKERQGNIISEMTEAHNQQLEILRTAIAEERKGALQAQSVYEETLRTKYESMVQALQEKVKAEQESRMRRALEDLERNARLESERARQMFEAQQSAELAVSNKFKHLVGDLRKSWEEEEASRAKQLEERLRNHYSAVLEHMESQLQMALKLQDEADRQWMEDVEARNKQQVSTMRAFEEKCRRLYETRLTDYIERTDQQLSEYEGQLLQVGGNMALERARFESRLRRLKLSCGRWKADYQKEIMNRYNEMVSVLETRYMGEIESLLSELADAREALTESENAVQKCEHELFEERRANDMLERKNVEGDRDRKAGRASLTTQRDNLIKIWQGLGTPTEERVQVLMTLLDCADYTPELAKKYEAVQKRFSARLPIMQLVMRRQKIEYKLKMIQKIANSEQLQGNEEMTRSEAMAAKPVLLTELNELRNSIEVMTRDYEMQYGEKFERAYASNIETTNNGYSSSSRGQNPASPLPRQSSSPPKSHMRPAASSQSQGQGRHPQRTPHKSPPPPPVSR